MKNLLIFLAVFVCFGAFGQQVNITSATANESVVVESMLPVGDDVVVFGQAEFQQVFSARISPLTGDVIWSYKSNESGSLTASALLPNGNFVAVGTQNSDGLVAVFSPAGVLVWSKVLYIMGSNVTFYDVTVSPGGDIFLVGREREQLAGSMAHDILLRLDATGNIQFSTKVLTQASRSAIHLRGDSVFVVGSTSSAVSFLDVSLGVYSAVNGSLLVYKSFGSFANEVFQNAEFSSQGIFFTYLTQGTGLHVGKILWSTLDLGGSPIWILPPANEALSSGKISVSTDGVYVSGGAVGIGFRRSFAVKLTHNLVPVWGRFLIPSTTPTSEVFGTCSLVLPSGDVLFCDLVDNPGLGTSATITGLSPLGSTYGNYCQNPSAFSFSGLDMGISTSVLFPVQSDIEFQEIDDPFFFLGIQVENCNTTILPVELTLFQVSESGRSVLVKWQTATELNTSHFNVLRSEDGATWKDLGAVSAAGNSQQIRDYSFVDVNPLTGTSYYKLESVDLDGSTAFSPTQVVHFDGRRQSVVVYPNPSVSGDPVTVRGEFQSVAAYGLDGRQVPIYWNGNQLAVQAGAGVYLLTFLSANGTSETVRVVIE